MSYIRIRMVKDSKNPVAGPYGPYAYLGRRNGDRTQERYLGKCGSIADMKSLRRIHGMKIFEKVENAVISRTLAGPGNRIR